MLYLFVNFAHSPARILLFGIFRRGVTPREHNLTREHKKEPINKSINCRGCRGMVKIKATTVDGYLKFILSRYQLIPHRDASWLLIASLSYRRVGLIGLPRVNPRYINHFLPFSVPLSLSLSLIVHKYVFHSPRWPEQVLAFKSAHREMCENKVRIERHATFVKN